MKIVNHVKLYIALAVSIVMVLIGHVKAAGTDSRPQTDTTVVGKSSYKAKETATPKQHKMKRGLIMFGPFATTISQCSNAIKQE